MPVMTYQIVHDSSRQHLQVFAALRPKIFKGEKKRRGRKRPTKNSTTPLHLLPSRLPTATPTLNELWKNVLTLSLPYPRRRPSFCFCSRVSGCSPVLTSSIGLECKDVLPEPLDPRGRRPRVFPAAVFRKLATRSSSIK